MRGRWVSDLGFCVAALAPHTGGVLSGVYPTVHLPVKKATQGMADACLTFSHRGPVLWHLLFPDRRGGPRQAARARCARAPRSARVRGSWCRHRALPEHRRVLGTAAVVHPSWHLGRCLRWFFILSRQMQCGQSTNVCSGLEHETGNV